jgi:hypothetical protein
MLRRSRRIAWVCTILLMAILMAGTPAMGEPVEPATGDDRGLESESGEEGSGAKEPGQEAPMNLRALRQTLGLTKTQFDQLELDETVIDGMARRARAWRVESVVLREELAEEDQKLTRMLGKYAPSRKTILRQGEQIGRLRMLLIRKRLHAVLDLRELLTADQFHHLRLLRDGTPIPPPAREYSFGMSCHETLEAKCPDAANDLAKWQCLVRNSRVLTSSCRDSLSNNSGKPDVTRPEATGPDASQAAPEVGVDPR